MQSIFVTYNVTPGPTRYWKEETSENVSHSAKRYFSIISSNLIINFRVKHRNSANYVTKWLKEVSYYLLKSVT